MNRFLKIMIWIAALLMVILLCFCGAAGIKYYRVTHSGAKVEMTGELSLPIGNDKITLGQKIPLTVMFKVPWGIRPSVINVEPSPGSQLTAEPQFRRHKIRWGYTRWAATVWIQTFREGVIKENYGQASFSNGQTIDLKVPALSVKPPAVKNNQLELAEQLKPRKIQKNSRSFYLWGLLGFAVLCVIILIIAKMIMRPKTHLLTPWEKAMEAIRALLDSTNNGKVAPEVSVSRLTDIVREYLERRFSLRAERQTTSEFLNDLEDNRKCLTEEQRNFLREFLTAADMVKFAKAAADRTLIEKAAAHAETLVRETIPDESAKENIK